MNPIFAAVQMGIFLFFIAYVMTRAVAEAGLMMTETSFLPTHWMSLVYPLPQFDASTLALSGTTGILFHCDMRGLLWAPLMDAQKMAGELKLRPRAVLAPLCIAFVLAFGTAYATYLWLGYSQGALSLYSWPMRQAESVYKLTGTYLQGSPAPADATAYGGFGVGIFVTMGLVWARSSFTWFPLHPLAYALAPTWQMIVLWFPVFMAWVIKICVLRFGGIETYKRLTPFMLGLILGEFSMAVFWSLMAMRGWNAPQFPWP